VRFETAPGQQAQFDFAEIRFSWGKRFALLVVLGYSRVLYVEFVTRQTALTVMLGLERAFGAFGGVPQEILFDQMKSVILDDQRPHGGRLLENPEFLRFAAHWGFRVRACRPFRAKTKGKVERPVGYLRGNFLYGRTFLGDADLADQCARWLVRANQRVHGTTRVVPLSRLAEEQTALLPLAARPYRSLVLTPPAPVPPQPARARLGRAPVAGELYRARPGGGLMPAPSLRDRLRAQLADLKMPGALEALDDILRRADSGELAAGEAMSALLGSHITLRNQRRLQTAMRSARLPAVKTLADFDFSFQPSVKRDQLESLHTLSFIERRENVVFLGPPGVGKTHLAVSLAVAAAEGGRRVYYATLADLITSLEDAQQAGRLSHRLRTLVFPSLMIIDEIGYLPISRTGAMFFFQLMSRRYEHASTVLTSNKGFEEWGEVLGDDVMAAALIDRLLHHCHIVNIRGNSYRMREHRALATRLATTPAKPPPPRARRPSRQEA